MSHNPPPAPDWIMGADGHWKPPPFDGAHALGHVARVVTDPTTTAPGPGPGPVGPPLPIVKPPRRTGVIVAIILGSVFAGFVALAFLAIVAVTFLGTSAEAQYTAIPDDTSPSLAGPTTGSGAADVDLADFCLPSPEVAAATGSTTGTMVPLDGGSFEVDGVALGGSGCRYADGTVVLALDDAGRDRATDLLERPAGAIPSLDVYFPAGPDPDGESVGTLFEVDDQVYAVITPGTDRPQLLALVAGVRALVE